MGGDVRRRAEDSRVLRGRVPEGSSVVLIRGRVDRGELPIADSCRVAAQRLALVPPPVEYERGTVEKSWVRWRFVQSSPRICNPRHRGGARAWRSREVLQPRRTRLPGSSPRARPGFSTTRRHARGERASLSGRSWRSSWVGAGAAFSRVRARVEGIRGGTALGERRAGAGRSKGLFHRRPRSRTRAPGGGANPAPPRGSTRN
jgi:hypothetical protein